jgi:hypothetical protein
MTTHPHHAKIVEAIKALPAYNDPQTFFESELAECYSDEELVAEFGWNDEKPLTVKQAVKAVRERCEVRNDVFGWIIEEGEAERRSAQEDAQRWREEQEAASRCGWLVERAFTFSDFEPDPNATDEENYENEQGYYSWMGDMSAECGGKVTEDCGAKLSDVIRNGVRVGWECEAGHRSISLEHMTDEEQNEQYRLDYEESF